VRLAACASAARHAMQAFVRGGGHCVETRVGEIDRFGAEAADAIHQQTQAARTAQRAERRDIVQAAGSRFVMNHCDVRERLVRVEPFGDLREIGRLHPVVLQRFMRDSILRGDLRNPLAVHAVFDDEQFAVLRHERSRHAFDSRGAGARHQHGLPFVRIETVHTDETRARLFLQIEKLAFAMAQIGLQQAVADAFGERHRAGIEQQHGRSIIYLRVHAAPMWRISRVFTSGGVMVGRGRPSGVPRRIAKRTKRGPSSCGASNN
jgi:hypothetical protein